MLYVSRNGNSLPVPVSSPWRGGKTKTGNNSHNNNKNPVTQNSLQTSAVNFAKMPQFVARADEN